MGGPPELRWRTPTLQRPATERYGFVGVLTVRLSILTYSNEHKEAAMTTTLTVTAKGQVTLRKEFLRHLGIAPGQKVEVDLLPNRRLELRAKPTGSIEDFFGCLYQPGTKPLSIEEITEIIADSWAGRR
jgi:antitoxin PrlF